MFLEVLSLVLFNQIVCSAADDCTEFVSAPFSGGIVATSYSDGKNDGSVVTFSCDIFWKLEGSKTAVCNSGSWILSDTDDPKCSKIGCTPISPPTNGDVSCTVGSSAGSVCSFSCNSGFDLKGSESAFCMGDGEWDKPAPVCKEMGCSELTNLPNGLIDCTDGSFIDSTCTFSCLGGYSLVGLPQVTCLGDKKWTGALPVCKEPVADIDSCVEINNLENGRVSCTDGAKKNSQCRFSCNSKYMLVGASIAMCTSGANWNASVPACEETQCFPPLTLIYEAAATCNNTNKLHSLCTIVCSESDKLEVQSCAESGGGGEGVWEVVSEPCPACDKAYLDVLILMHGSLPSADYQRLLSVVSVLFDRLFPLVISEHIWFRWAETNSSICRKSSDVVAKPVAGLNLTGLETVFKEIFQVAECVGRPHFLRIAHDFLSYTTRPLAKEVLIYIVIGDPSPETLAEALTISESGASISMVTLDSDTTHNIHTNFQHYMAKADHIPVVLLLAMDLQTSHCPGPRCDVDEMKIEHGSPVCSFIPNAGSVCEAQCNAGYMVNGSKVLECVQKGEDKFEWNSVAPTCIEQVCVEVSVVGDVSVVCSNGVRFLSECTFSCPDGLFLVGPQSIVCVENAERRLLWSDIPPTCEKDLLCQPPLVEPSQGSMSCPNGNHYNSICTVTCNEGYALSGHKTIECNAAKPDGTASRSASIPTCKACVNCKKDVLVVVDIAGSTSKDEFKNNLEVVLQVIEQYVGAIEEGDVYLGIVQIGGQPVVVCDSGDIADVFQVELDIASYPIALILSVVDNIEHVGACPATGRAFAHTVSYMGTAGRNSTSKLMILVTNADAFTNSEQVSEFTQQTGIELNVLNLGSSYQRSLKIIGRSSSRAINKTEVSKNVLIPEVNQAEGSVDFANWTFFNLLLFIGIQSNELWV